MSSAEIVVRASDGGASHRVPPASPDLVHEVGDGLLSHGLGNYARHLFRCARHWRAEQRKRDHADADAEAEAEAVTFQAIKRAWQEHKAAQAAS